MKIILSILGLIIGLSVAGQSEYKIAKTYHIPSGGGWDYIAINNNKIYVSHGTQVNILDELTGDSIGIITNTNGVHGIAFDTGNQRGYTSNGRSNSVTVFDLKTNDSITQITTGENPDAIFYEPYSMTIITCNGRGRNLSIIDPKTNTVIATIDVGGKPEAAAFDGNGNLYVNIEDKNEIVAIDMKTAKVLHHWSLTPGEGPTGLAFDKHTKRLFAGCEKLLVVVNSESGKVVTTVPIGDGCDGVAFDNDQKLIFTSNGEGTMSVIREDAGDKFTLLGNYPTKRGARTIAIDEAKQQLFLPAADFQAPESQGARPKMIPGTFQVLVMQASK